MLGFKTFPGGIDIIRLDSQTDPVEVIATLAEGEYDAFTLYGATLPELEQYLRSLAVKPQEGDDLCQS